MAFSNPPPASSRLDFTSLADLAASQIPDRENRIRVSGAITPNLGYAEYTRASVPGPGAGKAQDGKGVWWDLDPSSLSLEQLSAGTGVAGRDLQSFKDAARLRPVASLGRPLQTVGIDDPASYYDLTVRDDGSGKAAISGLYGKFVVPALAAVAATVLAGDLIADIHCPVSSQCAEAVEIALGDSIFTDQANTFSRSNMLWTTLQREVASQAGGKPIKFYNRSIGGKALANVFDTQINRATIPPWWGADDARSWLDRVRELRPTRIWISFGMNDGPAMSITVLRAVVAAIRAWDFDCDIVLMTCLLPRPYVGSLLPANGPWNTNADQEGKLVASGLVRTYAKFAGIGLVDINRWFMRICHGWDPAQTSLVRKLTSSAVTRGFAGTERCLDYKAIIVLDTSKLPDNSGVLVLSTGSGDADAIYVTHLTGNNYSLSAYAGVGGDSWQFVAGKSVQIVPRTGSVVRLCFEKTGNYATLYREGDGTDEYGSGVAPIWAGKIVHRGGFFIPSVVASADGAITGAAFDYGVPARFLPAATVTDLFGTGESAIETRMGSGYNHPGTLMDDYVYSPALQATRFFANDNSTRYFPWSLRVRGTARPYNRFEFNDAGFAAPDGALLAGTFVSAPGGVRMGHPNLAPRMYPEGSSISFATGGATDTAYYRFSSNGSFYVLNGQVAASGMRFSSVNPYPLLSDSSGGVLLTTGTTAAIAYVRIYANGDLGLLNGKLLAQGAVITGSLVLGSYTVGTVPAGESGAEIFVSNARKIGEGPGAGTGVPAYYSNSAWRRFSDDTQIAA